MPGNSGVVSVKGGLGQFRSLLELHGGLSVAHFCADWADQCGPMDEALNILAGETDMASVQFLRVDAEKEADVSLEFEVAAVPTIIFFGANGKKTLERVEGARVADVTKKVRELSEKAQLDARVDALNRAADSIETTAEMKEAPAKRESLEDRLKRLINQADVMVFMKGCPDEPRCGFSRQLINILQPLNVKFGTFDILSDDQVRQGLKTFSNWPTYPQMYVKGELVGGLDIIKELQEAGELEDTLKGE